MEAYVALGYLGALAAFCCGAALAISATMGIRRGSAGSLGGARAGRLSWRLRNGVGWTKPAARALLRVGIVVDLAEEAVAVARSRGFATSVEALLSAFIGVLGVVATIVGLCTASFAVAMTTAGCVCAVTIVWLRTAGDKRRDALREAVPDALRSMGTCFQSGLSLVQTFQQVAVESSEPLRSLFARGAHRMETGGSVEQALDSLRSASSAPELSFVAVALDVQHQAGGSMRQVLDAALDTVEGEMALRRSLKVQTAQARLSARIVSAMPFVLIAIFSLVSEGFLDPFLASPTGFALLGLALGMQAAGIMAVRRMLNVEVG